MKKYRPYKAGFIVLYILGLLSVGQTVFDIVTQMLGVANEYMSNFTFFSVLIAVMALMYIRMYAVTRTEIDEKYMRIVFPVYIKPRDGEKRAFFIYRQSENDLKLVNKRFALADLERYGYIEDLNYAQLDRSNAGENNKLFPVHEIALVMKDGKRYHMNGGFYSPKQLAGMVEQIHAATGLAPEGKLAELAPQKNT